MAELEKDKDQEEEEVQDLEEFERLILETARSCRHQRSDMRLRIFKCDIKIEEEASSEDEEEDYCDSKIRALKDLEEIEETR